MIEKANLSDLQELYILENEVFDSTNYPLSKASFRYHIKKNLIYIYRIQNKIAGYILVLVRKKSYKLYSVAVLKDYRGQSVASKLLDEFLKTADKDIILEVRVDNIGAIELYKKKGFQVVKISKNFYKDGCDAYIMKKAFSPS